METKLTYENMYQLVYDYFMNFENTPDQGLDQGKAEVGKFFSKELITRRRCWPSLTNLDEWLAVLVDNYPNHRYDINIDKPYGYVCIDPETGMVCVQMREDVYDVELKKVVRCIMNHATFMCRIEDGQVKFYREHICRFPCYFQADSLEKDYPRNMESWMYMDYSNELQAQVSV